MSLLKETAGRSADTPLVVVPSQTAIQRDAKMKGFEGMAVFTGDTILRSTERLENGNAGTACWGISPIRPIRPMSLMRFYGGRGVVVDVSIATIVSSFETQNR